MIIEIYRNELKKHGTTKKAIQEGFFMVWTPERIKNAFSFGHGTEKDLRRYMNDNKIFCVFKDISANELINLYPGIYPELIKGGCFNG